MLFSFVGTSSDFPSRWVLGDGLQAIYLFFHEECAAAESRSDFEEVVVGPRSDQACARCRMQSV